MKRIEPQIESRILALITRGDTYDDIVRQLASEGTPVDKTTIVNVKGRNKETLQYMKQTLVQHEIDKSTEILAKTRQLLDRKLKRALQVDDRLDELRELLKMGDLTPGEYADLVKIESKNDLSVAVLTGLSKEMFGQSRIEQGKSPDKPESPDEARAKLKTLLDGINEKDERKIVQAIFPDA